MYGPCSRTTTLKPLVDSSLARTPPAAPEPTMTKSTTSQSLYFVSSVMAAVPVDGEIVLVILRGSLCGRRLPARVVPVVVAEGRLKSVLGQAADHGPAHAAAIAASIRFRVNQKTGQGVRANGFEELRGRAGDEIRARPARRRFRTRFIERFKNRHLLFGSCRGEKGRGGKKPLQPLMNFGNTLPVNLLLGLRKR